MKRWNSPISDSEAAKRAGGRRRYNRQRQIEAIHRQVAALNMASYTQLSKAEMARRLGVSRSTLWRYLRVFNGGKAHVKRPHGFVFGWGKPWRAYGYWY